MNVLMVSNYPSDTGYAWWLMEHFWLLLNEVAVMSGGCAYLAYPKINRLSDNIASSRINVVELEVGSKVIFGARVLRFIKKNNVEVVYFTDRDYFDVNYILLRAVGVKIIMVHDHTPGDRPPVRGVKGLIKSLRNNLPLLTADYFINVSPFMKQRSILNGRIPSRKCHVVQNGVNYMVPNSDAGSVRSKLGIADDRVVAVASGRLHPYKRFDFIVSAINNQKILLRKKKLLVLFIGDGPDRDRIKQLIKSYGIDDLIWMLGEREDIPNLLNMSDFAIHASLGEGFSLSIIEFMSHGLPVIVPNIPSVSQAIEDEINGLIFNRSDVSNLADKILLLVSDKYLRLKLGTQGEKKAVRDYTLEVTTNQFIKLVYPIFGVHY